MARKRRAAARGASESAPPRRRGRRLGKGSAGRIYLVVLVGGIRGRRDGLRRHRVRVRRRRRDAMAVGSGRPRPAAPGSSGPPTIWMLAASKARLMRQAQLALDGGGLAGHGLRGDPHHHRVEQYGSRPSTSIGPQSISFQGSSLPIRSPTAAMISFTLSRSSAERTVTSTPAVDQPWERLPIRLTSPLPDVPDLRRCRRAAWCTHSPTSMTSPEATPASMLSPTRTGPPGS